MAKFLIDRDKPFTSYQTGLTYQYLAGEGSKNSTTGDITFTNDAKYKGESIIMHQELDAQINLMNLPSYIWVLGREGD